MSLTTAVVVVVGSLPFLALTVWAMVDAATRDFGSTRTKAIWILVAAIPYVGAAVYFMGGARRGRRPGAGCDRANAQRRGGCKPTRRV